MGSAKEYFANERISANEAETARANARAAEAEARAAEANLELAKFRAPRFLDPSQRETVADAIKPFAPQQFFGMLPTSGFDVNELWSVLDSTLRSAGWIREAPPQGLVVGNPPHGVIVEPVSGLVLEVAKGRVQDVGKAAVALADALRANGIAVNVVQTDAQNKNAAMMRIVVGLKPQ
jgi:hypothetical protein